MLRPRAGGRGGGEVGDPAGSARRRPRSRLPHVSLRLGPPPSTLGVPRPAPRDQQKLRPLLSVLSPRSSQLVPAQGSHLPAPQPPAPARAPACAAAAAGREGKRKSGSASGWVRLGPRTRCRCRRLYGRVRTEERKGRSRVEPKLPPELTPDPRAVERACSVAVSFRAGGDCSLGSKEEAQAARPWSGAHHPKEMGLQLK
ncbi:hypothetical protein AB1E18_012838 [Capra hircus]